MPLLFYNASFNTTFHLNLITEYFVYIIAQKVWSILIYVVALKKKAGGVHLFECVCDYIVKYRV